MEKLKKHYSAYKDQVLLILLWFIGIFLCSWVSWLPLILCFPYYMYVMDALTTKGIMYIGDILKGIKEILEEGDEEEIRDVYKFTPILIVGVLFCPFVICISLYTDFKNDVVESSTEDIFNIEKKSLEIHE